LFRSAAIYKITFLNAYDQIFAVVHFVCPVLAAGPFGPAPISHNLVVAAALPDSRNCRWRYSRTDWLHRYASGAPFAKNLIVRSGAREQGIQSVRNPIRIGSRAHGFSSIVAGVILISEFWILLLLWVVYSKYLSKIFTDTFSLLERTAGR
jgi:hypothetical protein